MLEIPVDTQMYWPINIQLQLWADFAVGNVISLVELVEVSLLVLMSIRINILKPVHINYKQNMVSLKIQDCG